MRYYTLSQKNQEAIAKTITDCKNYIPQLMGWKTISKYQVEHLDELKNKYEQTYENLSGVEKSYMDALSIKYNGYTDGCPTLFHTDWMFIKQIVALINKYNKEKNSPYYIEKHKAMPEHKSFVPVVKPVYDEKITRSVIFEKTSENKSEFFYSSHGWNCTYYNFYKVVGYTEKGIRLQPVEKKQISGDNRRFADGIVIPTNIEKGESFIAKKHIDKDGKIGRYSYKKTNYSPITDTDRKFEESDAD